MAQTKRSIELSEIIKLMREVNERLSNSIRELHKQAKEQSRTEKEYKVALAYKILKLRSENVPVTIINDLARGDEHIAELRFQRDVARSLYETAKEGMRSLRVEASVLQTISKYQDEL